MSYISTVDRLDFESGATLSGTPPSAGPAPVASGLAAPAPNPVIGGLEIALFVTMLSGVSLTLCTIAAGAFGGVGAFG